MSDTSASTDKILFLLKARGEQTAKQLSQALDMTSMGARQHLLQLQSQGLVCAVHRAEKVGRPSQYWQLTDKAFGRFPDAHRPLALQLLQSARELYGEEGVNALVQHREKALKHEYMAKMAEETSLQGKLEALCLLRSKEGYMAEWFQQSEGVFWFVENHCPICDAAKSCASLCQSEMELLQSCLGDGINLSRQEHILQGQRRCSYQITKKSCGVIKSPSS
ncbi:transcriptional regulator [Aliiglaciecola sp. CAU 1673]|uniref:helix-turn-helix transcriptional regulator n=1 Tax=Aliiglaciecola sp. CAU 1673 TaxID=3032595 RepID=UPI0023DAFA42|nr:metalloregulator ArsR/SmtB family transcription factor [Aliiglaciecola sp. CAU 1673]MDF2179746.1 transcriptional regulator [Aliiglaciecola sp. CAU 1673]